MAVEKTDVTFDAGLVNQPMSRLSKMVFRHSDVSAIVAKRRANYLFLQRELASVYRLEFFVPELPTGICPWIFPLVLGGESSACATMRAQGIPAVTWNGVRPSGMSWDLFPDADYLYKNLVFLPVHQNLSEQELRQIVQAVKLIQQSRSLHRIESLTS